MNVTLTGSLEELNALCAKLCDSLDWDIARFGVQIYNQLENGEYYERTRNHPSSNSATRAYINEG